MRLNRYISASGYASRRKGEKIIREGMVRVNGTVVTDPARTIEPSRDSVSIDGELLVINREKRYYILNKPMGVIVSRIDTHGRPTVIDLLGSETKGVYPVGRLDANTYGVLLFTDDGDLAYRLTHPSFGVEKVYRAEVESRVSTKDVQRVHEGLILEDGPTVPAKMNIIESGEDVSLIEITMHEGRKRQVRRMLARLGHPVKVLERISFGGITADDLPLGGYRPLYDKEIETLKKTVSLFHIEDGP
ncbi:pseudouridine synthase [Candidatus Latescibacterota bacterium]